MARDPYDSWIWAEVYPTLGLRLSRRYLYATLLVRSVICDSGYTSSPPPPVGDVRAMHTNLMRATSIKLETKQGIIAESFLQAPVRAGVAAILITYDRSKEA